MMSAALGQTQVLLPNPQHQIFFDFGRPVLSRDAEASLEEVVAAVKAAPNATIEVRGYSDSAGSRRANFSVSLLRAEAVRSFLTKHLSGPRIIVSAHGEDGLLIPTADGVREPQNRRVEIRLVQPG